MEFQFREPVAAPCHQGDGRPLGGEPARGRGADSAA